MSGNLQLSLTNISLKGARDTMKTPLPFLNAPLQSHTKSSLIFTPFAFIHLSTPLKEKKREEVISDKSLLLYDSVIITDWWFPLLAFMR